MAKGCATSQSLPQLSSDATDAIRACYATVASKESAPVCSAWSRSLSGVTHGSGGCSDPKSSIDDSAALTDNTNAFKTVATMHNIPCGCTSEEVMAAVRHLGFENAFQDFVMPMHRRDFGSRRELKRNREKNKGWALFCFSDVELCHRFASAFEGFKFKERGSNKTVRMDVIHDWVLQSTWTIANRPDARRELLAKDALAEEADVPRTPSESISDGLLSLHAQGVIALPSSAVKSSPDAGEPTPLMRDPGLPPGLKLEDMPTASEKSAEKPVAISLPLRIVED